jgi:hypothetical protein
MKKLVLLFALIGTSVYAQKSTLNRNERIFVKNVIKLQNEKPVEITKRKDNHIVVEFDTTIVVLKPDGFVGEMWIRTDGDWERLTEE